MNSIKGCPQRALTKQGLTPEGPGWDSAHVPAGLVCCGGVNCSAYVRCCTQVLSQGFKQHLGWCKGRRTQDSRDAEGEEGANDEVDEEEEDEQELAAIEASKVRTPPVSSGHILERTQLCHMVCALLIGVDFYTTTRSQECCPDNNSLELDGNCQCGAIGILQRPGLNAVCTGFSLHENLVSGSQNMERTISSCTPHSWRAPLGYA